MRSNSRRPPCFWRRPPKKRAIVITQIFDLDVYRFPVGALRRKDAAKNFRDFAQMLHLGVMRLKTARIKKNRMRQSHTEFLCIDPIGLDTKLADVRPVR
ncbi:hypothetical protein GCM10011499_11370 [Pelagibacterium lentulum]|uniref:Uncharacterized protein n=1 Tax=Pelagibacterium lentulum TaxID=2029865 RepID=A0A916RB59_9HYPH|nr:hypothetical protein GCM10011499_11370 [Pelagibacterium lentulum]